MEELAKSFATWLKERTSNPIYFTFLFYILICSWREVYVLFFEDAALLVVPRIEYIQRFNQGVYETVLWHMLVPAALTFGTVKYLPRIYTWAHRHHLKHHYERLAVADEARRDYEVSKARYTAEVADAREQQVKDEERIHALMSEEEKWDEEFAEAVVDTEFVEALNNAYRVVYGKDGYYTTNLGKKPDFREYISSKSLSILETNGLVTLSRDDNSRAALTQKGLYFLKSLREHEKMLK
jgi:hypothetical protein